MTTLQPLGPTPGQNDDERATLNDIIRHLSNLQIELIKYLEKPEKNEKQNHVRGGSQSGRSKTQTRDDERLTILKLRSDIGQMKKEFEELAEFENHVGKELKLDLSVQKLKAKLNKEKNEEKLHVAHQITNDLKEMSKKIFNLRCEMPLTRYKRSSGGLSLNYSQNAQGYDAIDEEGTDLYLPGLQMKKDFVQSSVFKEVKEKFNKLEFTRKLCLLSFAVFPENSEVKKTMLMYWWMGEGFIHLGKQGENSVAEILDEFSTKRLIEPVKDDRKLKPNSYKMDPEVHSSVIRLANDLDFFKVYGEKGKPTMAKSDPCILVRPVKKSSTKAKLDSCKKVCLVEKSSSQPEAKVSKMNPGDLATVFNASERFPDFTFKWFPLMASLEVLYLGRWERTAERHIEVESTKSLENLGTMKKLKLVSFQGISRIEKLSDSICKLPELKILDLRACYSLENLPEEIDSLQNLIYLDVSECYMLDRMPKKIAGLTNLEVLKGFVVSDAEDESCCTVPELRRLHNLRKLSINVNQAKFEMESLIKPFERLSQLESLKVAWGAIFSHNTAGKEDTQEITETKGAPPMEVKDGRHGDDKGQTSEEKKADGEKTGDKVPSKKEDDKGHNKVQTLQDKKPDGRNIGADLEESKESNRAEETGTLRNETEDKVQSKEEDDKGSSKVQALENKKGDRTNTEAGLEESKVHSGVVAKTQMSDEIADKDKKPNHPPESKATNQQIQKDEIVEEDKKPNPTPESKATIQKLDKMVEEDKKPSPTPGLNAMDQKKTDDHKEDNDKVTTAAAKPLDPNRGKGRVSTEDTPDATPTSKNKERAAKGKESNDSAKPAPPRHVFDKMKSGINRIQAKKPKEVSEPSGPKLPSSLMKLELECYPGEELPSWLYLENLAKLEKLSIKGGELRRISNNPPATERKCSVRVLRLKYLDKFEAEWRDLLAMFPDMVLFEKYKCPKVTLCPCDGMGVWRSKTVSKKPQEMPQ